MKNAFRKITTFMMAALLIASLPLTALATTSQSMVNDGSVSVLPDHNINVLPGFVMVSGGAPTPELSEETPEQEERGYFTVDGKWSQTGKDGTLTVTALASKSRLKITHWGIQGLLDTKVHTIVFVTDEAESTLNLEELKSDEVFCCTLRHNGEETSQELK